MPILVFRKIKNELQVKPKAWWGYMNAWLDIAGRMSDLFDRTAALFTIYIGTRTKDTSLEEVH